MQVWAVQALVVILDNQLPVGLDVVDDPSSQAEILHAPGAELAGKVGELFRQPVRRSGRMTIEVEEEVSVPDLDRDAVQGKVLLLEMRHFVHVRRPDEAPIEAVGPRVVRALDAAGELAGRLRAESRAAMPTDVVEGVHASVRRSRDDDAVARHVAEDELAGACDFLGPASADPHRTKQRIELAFEVGRVGVERCRQRGRSSGHDVARFDDDIGVGHEVS